MKKGFTLIELLIVIAILAVLSAGVVLFINPAEKFRETRDVQRLTDLRLVKDAIQLYLTTNNSSPTSLNEVPEVPLTPDSEKCRAGNAFFPAWRTSLISISVSGAYQPFINSVVDTPVISNPRGVTGSGWVPVKFNEISIGNPLSKLPLDPVNAPSANSAASLATPFIFGQISVPDGSYYYAYQCQGLTYEINANMESKKYGNDDDGDPKDVESKDGGTAARYFICFDPQQGGEICASLPSQTFIADHIYEVGNDPGLDL